LNFLIGKFTRFDDLLVSQPSGLKSDKYASGRIGGTMKVIALWLVTIGLILFGQILEGGHVGSVLQFTAASIVLLPVLAYLFYAFGFKGMFRFIKRVIASNVAPEDSAIIDNAVTLGFLFSGLGAVFGLIHVMENLSDTSKLGAGIAVAFVSVVYGILPGIFLLPVKHHQHPKSESSTGMLKKAAGFSAASFLMLMFSFFVVLYATSYRN
jgi:flagellar motor component MotA